MAEMATGTAHYVIETIRLFIEVIAAMAPGMTIGVSIGVMANATVPEPIAFVIALSIGLTAFVAFRIAMATLLSPLMLDETVEQWAIGR